MMAAKAPVKVSDRLAPLTSPDEHEESSARHAAQEIPIELLVTARKRQKKRTKTRALTKVENEQMHSRRSALLSSSAMQKRRIGLSLLRHQRTSGNTGMLHVLQAPAK